MSEFKPDFNRLKKVLLRLGEPDILPLYELGFDNEVIRALSVGQSGPGSFIEFFYRHGYDYAPAYFNYEYQYLIQSTKDTAELSRGQRTFLEHNQGIIETRKDLDLYKWQVINGSVANHINEAIKYLPDGMKLIPVTPGGIFENVMRLMGYIPFSYALLDDEQLVWDLFEIIGSDYVKLIKTCLENTDISKIGAIVLADDMGFNHSTMIAPEHLRKYVFPWQRMFTDIAHSFDLPVILHSCGKLDEVMDDIINYVGVDAKHSFEDKIMHITEAKKRYGNRIALLGGIDMHFLCTANETELRRYIDEVIACCAPGGGYALGSGNTIANFIPVQNFLIMVDERSKAGTYPIKLHR